MGSGAQVRRAPAAAGTGPGTRWGFLRVQLAPLLCSAAAEGLPRVWFPARDGTDSRSPGGKERGRGWNGNHIRSGSPGGCWGRVGSDLQTHFVQEPCGFLELICNALFRLWLNVYCCNKLCAS